MYNLHHLKEFNESLKAEKTKLSHHDNGEKHQRLHRSGILTGSAEIEKERSFVLVKY